jgi:hypothetical protein
VPIRALPLLSRPSLFPFSTTPPGRAIAHRSSAYLQTSPVEFDLASEPRASSSPLSPPPLSGAPSNIFLRFIPQQIVVFFRGRASPTLATSPAATPRHQRKRLTPRITQSSLSRRSAHRRPLHRLREASEHRRRPISVPHLTAGGLQ